MTGLALDDGPGGPVAYLALWRPRPAGAGGDPAAPGRRRRPRHRVVAVDARTGAPVAVLPLDGVPVLVALGPAPGRLGRRLYAVERLAGPEDDPPRAAGARLLGLHPTTLEVESERPLDFVPARLVVAPDGDVAYALHDHRLTRLGLAGGPDRSVALPARGLALAVAARPGVRLQRLRPRAVGLPAPRRPAGGDAPRRPRPPPTCWWGPAG